MMTIKDIEEQYGIKGTKLKNIRNTPNFNFPASHGEPGYNKLYKRAEVEAWFKNNKHLLKNVSCYSDEGNGQTIGALLAFYNRNSTRLSGSGGGTTITQKIRRSLDEHWDNEHQRAVDQSSFGNWGYDSVY